MGKGFKKSRLACPVIFMLVSSLSIADRYGRVEVFDVGKSGAWHYEVNAEFAFAEADEEQGNLSSAKFAFICENNCYFKVETSVFSSMGSKSVCDSKRQVDVLVHMESARHTVRGVCVSEGITSISVLLPFNHELYSDLNNSKTAKIGIYDTTSGDFIAYRKFSLSGSSVALSKVRDYGIHLGVFDDPREDLDYELTQQ